MTVLVGAGREAELKDAMRRHPAGKQRFPYAPGDQEILDTAYTNLNNHLEVLIRAMETDLSPTPEHRWWHILQLINSQIEPESVAPYLAAAIVRLGK